MADEKAGKSNERQEDILGDSRGASSRGGVITWLRKIIGPPEERKTRLIAIGGLLVVLLILGLYSVVNYRSTERKNVATLGVQFEQSRAVVRFSVQSKEVSEGVVVTSVHWAELGPSGVTGNEQDLEIPGDAIHVGVREGTIKHRKLDEPVSVAYFSTVAGEPGEPIPLVEEDGPFYFQFNGDKQRSVRRTSTRLWKYLTGAKPTPGYLEVSTVELAGLDVELLQGEEWEISLGPTGAVTSRRLRSPLDEYELFSVSTPVQTVNGLEVSIEEANRQVEFAEQIDPDLIFCRTRIRLHNAGKNSLTIDPYRFELQDEQHQVYRPSRTSQITLAPGSGQTLRLRFMVQPGARQLRFTIPGEKVAGGDGTQPLVIFLDRDESYLGDAQPVGDFLTNLDRVERQVTEDGFQIVAVVEVVNLTWDSQELKTGQFTLENLTYSGGDPIEATSLSIQDIEPFLPEKVSVTFPIGRVMERADMTLRFKADRKKVVHQEAVFNVVPLPDPEGKALVGRTLLRQMAGANHYLKYMELSPTGRKGVLAKLTDTKARQRQALHHLGLAESYFPESVVIAAVRE